MTIREGSIVFCFPSFHYRGAGTCGSNCAQSSTADMGRCQSELKQDRLAEESQPCFCLSPALPLSFWAGTLASYVHVSIGIPTASIGKATTPYELWHWEEARCLSFRVGAALGPMCMCRGPETGTGFAYAEVRVHWVSCVPYKGWKFYDLFFEAYSHQ